MTAPGDHPLAVEAIGLTRVYGSGPTAVRALDAVDLTIAAGQFVVLLGPSGSGKTTLLNLVGGIDSPTEGRIVVGGLDVAGLDRTGLARFRREQVSFVFQFFNLIPTLTSVENVELVAGLTGADQSPESRGSARRRRVWPPRSTASPASSAAVSNKGWRWPGPWRNRHRCCWPTNRPAPSTGLPATRCFRCIRRACDEHGRTVIVVTHDHTVAAIADRVVHLVDGAVTRDEAVTEPIRPADRTLGV